MQETSNIYTNNPTKGLITDLHDNLVSKEFWTFARNAQLNSHLGQTQFIQNEPSNYKCVDLPYTPIGFIQLLNNKWAVFTTDNTSSEIGIFDEKACTYTKLVNDNCLNFNTSYLVQGTSREVFDCSETIYWTDTNNPRRKLNLDNIPYKYTILDDACETKDYNNQLDCDELLIERKLTVPCIQSRLSVGGALLNGTYQFALAYTINKYRVSDFYSVTRPQSIWSHQNLGQAIDLEITNLDRDYNQYQLVAIFTIDGVTSYRTIGYYSTSQEFHHINSVNRPEYEELTLTELITARPRYSHADLVVSNDKYLLWAGVKTSPELNYQKQAMQIDSEYVVYRVPQDYYAKGGQLVGYNRDEAYSFGIQWVDEKGEWSPIYHIGGRKAKAGEKSFISGRDVYELTDPTCHDVLPKKFEVENTGGNMIPYAGIPICDEVLIGYGEMAYTESTELYPDNEEMFGEDKCTPIRHHKFPDNCKTHIYSDAGKYINILGVRFKNIQHPKDSSGNPVQGLVGYRIVRGNREGNRTVIAKGIVTNMRQALDIKEPTKVVYYPNYPYNSLQQDPFLSAKEVFYKNGERDYFPQIVAKRDTFSFYGPHTLFSNISLGNELVFLTEEHGIMNGYHERPYKQPKQKLLTNFDLYFALLVGTLNGFLALTGKKVYTTRESLIAGNPILKYEDKVTATDPGIVIERPAVPGVAYPSGIPGVPGSTYNPTVGEAVMIETADSIINGYANPTVGPTSAIKIISTSLEILAKVGMFFYFSFQAAKEVLDIIYEIGGWQEYAMQQNSSTLYNNYYCTLKDNKRRRIQHYQYIYDGINTVEGNPLNNYKRQNSVYFRLNDAILDPVVTDNTLANLEDLDLCNDIFKSFQRQSSLWYVANKRKIPNQYGQLDSIEYLDTGHCVTDVSNNGGDLVYDTDLIFGGDTFISKFAIKDSMHYFSEYLYDVPDGFQYDYQPHRNVAYPRFWIDSNPYDISEFFNLFSAFSGGTAPNPSNVPRNKRNLNCQGNNLFAQDGLTVIRNQFFYLFNSGVKEFFVESDYNIDYRDWKGDKPTFYNNFNRDLSTLFKSKIEIEKREEFIYDKTFSKQLLENSLIQQRLDFDPLIDTTCFQYLKNRVIYSMPASKEQKGDSWQINLINNYYDFPLAEFGDITAMHGVDNEQIMFLFDKASPYITIGRDELELDGSGKKITLGDGGLFSREPRSIAYSDFHYGNSQSKWAFVNTQFGSFYPSQRQGRTFEFNGKLEEFSRNGMHWWFKNYLPSQLLDQFPNFKRKDNPVTGVGLLSVFDNTEEKYYLTKRDYRLKDQWVGKIYYNESLDKFQLGANIPFAGSGALVIDTPQVIDLDNTNYFEDVSWTISYSPKDKLFVSWHDWHPQWNLQTEKHFMSVKNKAIWKHNDKYDSFCNYYGTQYPFAFEFVVNNGQQNEILRSVEYNMEVGKYFNRGQDFHHVLDDNFDYMVISNSEQISGNLHLNLQKKNSMLDALQYPKINTPFNQIEVAYSKEEQKYRVNQFWDVTKDRGEFTNFNYPLWVTASNGYVKTINPQAVNLLKKDTQRKKFRNLYHKIMLTKTNPEDKKYIFKLNNSKENLSQR